MALIHYKRKNIIVDIGSTKESLATNIISTYLKKKNIQRIDAIILTHFHTDHINGINEDLLKKINVDKVMFSRPKDDQKEYTDMVSLLKENNISMIEVTRDEEITIGDINIYILSPDINYKINDKDIANANSIVSIITINNKNLMFMGDATKASEKYIMSHSNITLKDIYAYQVGHHGSKTSSQDEFISYFNITYAIISAKKKVYNHPAEETLNTLLRHNIKIKVTEKVGSVKLGI